MSALLGFDDLENEEFDQPTELFLEYSGINVLNFISFLETSLVKMKMDSRFKSLKKRLPAKTVLQIENLLISH